MDSTASPCLRLYHKVMKAEPSHADSSTASHLISFERYHELYR